MAKKNSEGIEVTLPAPKAQTQYIHEFTTKQGIKVKIRKAYAKDSMTVGKIMQGNTDLMTMAMAATICEFDGEKLTMETIRDTMDMRDFNEVAASLYDLGFLG